MRRGEGWQRDAIGVGAGLMVLLVVVVATIVFGGDDVPSMGVVIAPAVTAVTARALPTGVVGAVAAVVGVLLAWAEDDAGWVRLVLLLGAAALFVLLAAQRERREDKLVEGRTLTQLRGLTALLAGAVTPRDVGAVLSSQGRAVLRRLRGRRLRRDRRPPRAARVRRLSRRAPDRLRPAGPRCTGSGDRHDPPARADVPVAAGHGGGVPGDRAGRCAGEQAGARRARAARRRALGGGLLRLPDDHPAHHRGAGDGAGHGRPGGPGAVPGTPVRGVPARPRPTCASCRRSRPRSPTPSRWTPSPRWCCARAPLGSTPSRRPSPWPCPPTRPRCAWPRRSASPTTCWSGGSSSRSTRRSPSVSACAPTTSS